MYSYGFFFASYNDSQFETTKKKQFPPPQKNASFIYPFRVTLPMYFTKVMSPCNRLNRNENVLRKYTNVELCP